MLEYHNNWWEYVPSRKTRVIPVLLLSNGGFVKTVRFKDPVYLGDPFNIVKIFNEKEVDEILILDINASPEKEGPNFDFLAEIAGECFMPLAYGGGVKTIDDISKLTSLGYEKVCINTTAIQNPALIEEAAKRFGSSTIMVAMDVKKNLFGKYDIYSKNGREKKGLDPVKQAKLYESLGAGELLINSIDGDGTMMGYDLKIIKQISSIVSIPVVACGGAGNTHHLADGVNKAGASAVSAGSMFVFQGKLRGVLITMPTESELSEVDIP